LEFFGTENEQLLSVDRNLYCERVGSTEPTNIAFLNDSMLQKVKLANYSPQCDWNSNLLMLNRSIC